MDNRPIDQEALAMSPVGKEYDRIMSKIRKLQDTIKKDFETSQEKPETYIYKRAVTSLEFHTTCLERADQALQKRKDYLRQKYEEDLLKAEQDNEKDVLKYTKGIESANMIMEEEKKKKKSKTVIHAEYDIAQLQQQLNKLNLPRYGDNVMSGSLPKKVVKMTVVVDLPILKKLSLPKQLISQMPVIVITDKEDIFIDKCKFKWYISSKEFDTNDWELVNEGVNNRMIYLNENAENKYVKIVCTPNDGIRDGLPIEVISNKTVEKHFDINELPMTDRHKLTTEKMRDNKY